MIASFFGLLTRLVLALATVLLVLSLLAVAAVTMFFLLLWSLLRGKRPVIDLSAFTRARQFRAGRPMPPKSPRKPAGEVVDVEVREVAEGAEQPRSNDAGRSGPSNGPGLG